MIREILALFILWLVMTSVAFAGTVTITYDPEQYEVEVKPKKQINKVQPFLFNSYSTSRQIKLMSNNYIPCMTTK